MKKDVRLSIVVLLANIMFYVGIFGAILLHIAEDNTPKWLLVIICLVVGMIGSVIPGFMINIGIQQVSVKFVRMGMVIKYVTFLACIILLDRVALYTIILIGVLLGIDLLVEVLLVRDVYRSNVGMKLFIEKIKAFDTSSIDKVMKDFVLNIFCLLLFVNIHENLIETVIMLIFCVGVHGYTSERILLQMNLRFKKNSWKVRAILWGIESVMMMAAYLDKSIMVCVLFGSYYAIATDLILKRKTSIVWVREKEDRE